MSWHLAFTFMKQDYRMLLKECELYKHFWYEFHKSLY